ncbi:MAG TPA: type IV pilus twitching motility protein PilT, partial [Acidimicrobiales bacterium]|nr:type IV pilus twitching motility protein PilT [Acidimicrobiales bacterium]
EAFKLVPELLAREIGAIGYRLENDRLTLACAEPISATELRQLSEFLEREIAGCVLAEPAGIERIMAAVYPRLASGTADGATAPAIQGADLGQLSAEVPIGAASVQSSLSDDVAGNGHTSAFDSAMVAPPPPPPPPATAQMPATAPATGRMMALDELEEHFAGHEPGSFQPSGMTGGLDLDELLTYAVENGASDLHLTTQLPPMIRIDGSLRPIENVPRLDNEQIREMLYRILTQSLRERFEAERELDTSHMIVGVGRFRVNVFQQRGTIGAVLRSIPHEIPAFESLGLPEVVSSFAELRRGLVLVTGPTGSGKSTTLASLISIINRTKPLHIMTIEDPIEFLHSHQRAIINQREVGADTTSFAEALRHVLRQDPDVILVGEMRDTETIATALTAAETGHLVFATLHTQDAPQTVDRVIDVFPTGQQDQVRIQLAGSLEAVVTQQLIISATGLGRVPVAEVMVCTPAIRNLIRSAKTHQIYSLMQTGGSLGMQTMDQGLARAVKDGRITEAVAFDRCHDPAELRDHLKG